MYLDGTCTYDVLPHPFCDILRRGGIHTLSWDDASLLFIRLIEMMLRFIALMLTTYESCGLVKGPFEDESQCLVVSIGVVTLSSSFRRSWPIMMAFRRSLSPCGLHVLIYRVVIPCYDFHSRWSTTFVTCLGVGCHRVWCDQHCLRLRCEVVHLRCQLCICHNSHIAVLLTPIKYVRVSQFVGILLDAVTTY